MTTKRKETRESVCYREIKKKIRNGELKPGDRLIENTLSQQLEISRTPIRKAIGMLAQMDMWNTMIFAALLFGTALLIKNVTLK